MSSLRNENIVTVYGIGILMFSLSSIVPVLLIPSVIVLFLPWLWSSLFPSGTKPRSYVFDDISTDIEDQDSILKWKKLVEDVDKVDELVFTHDTNPLAVLSTLLSVSAPEMLHNSKGSRYALSAGWMSIGESNSQAFTKEFTDVQSFRFLRVGRILSGSAKNKFSSRFDTPEMEESAMSVEDQVNTVLKPSKLSEVIRCGDVFHIQSVQTGKYLYVQGSSIVFGPKPPGYKGVFQLIVQGDNGEPLFGTALTAGRPFRLRSARWPQYEVGLTSSETSTNGKSSFSLTLYELTAKSSKGVTKTKSNLTVHTLDMCFVSQSPRSSLAPILEKKFSAERLYQMVPGARTPPSYEVQILAWMELMHRTTTQKELALMFLSRERTAAGFRTWVSVRTVPEFSQVLSVLEQVTFTNESARSDSTEAAVEHGYEYAPRLLSHEASNDQMLRTLKQRLGQVLHKDLRRPLSWFPSSRGTVVPVREVIQRYFSRPSLSDSEFLVSGREVLRVRIVPTPAEPLIPILQFNVARPVWDTLWNEEILAIFPGQISFYPPDCDRPAQTILAKDILTVTKVPDLESPLPGFYALRIETLGHVQTVVFATPTKRHDAAAELLRQINTEGPFEFSSRPQPRAKMLAMAKRIFSQISPLRNGSHPDPKAVGQLGPLDADKFSSLSPQWLPSQTRRVLNSRLSVSDIHPHRFGLPLVPATGRPEHYWDISARLLKNIADLSRGSQQDDDDENDVTVSPPSPKVANGVQGMKSFGGPRGDGIQWDKFIPFLDDACKLKAVDLSLIDYGSPEALCFFSNVYHTLLLHARYVLGRPSQKEWSNFFSTTCYEIGGDVFSLAELEQCVLRGKLSRPKMQSKYDPVLVSGADNHSLYSVLRVDARINFLVNSGSTSNKTSIYLLTPQTLEKQLSKASQSSLSHSISVDTKARTVYLPKVCEIYLSDFGDNPQAVLIRCQQLLEGAPEAVELSNILAGGEKLPNLKYLQFIYESSPKLKLVV